MPVDPFLLMGTGQAFELKRLQVCDNITAIGALTMVTNSDCSKSNLIKTQMQLCNQYIHQCKFLNARSLSTGDLKVLKLNLHASWNRYLFLKSNTNGKNINLWLA